MNTTPQFFLCSHCGNVIEKLYDTGVPVMCCGEAMHPLTANTKDAALEKHVPVYTRQGDTLEVQVGSVLHPSLPEHYIGWIWLQTQQGGQRRKLEPGMDAKATFVLAPGDAPIAIYEWCNLHGLWKVEL